MKPDRDGLESVPFEEQARDAAGRQGGIFKPT